MKQKSGYFSNIKNLIMFVICMLFLFAIIVCSAILVIDAGNQARSGASEYVPNNSFLYFFATLVIAFVPYLVIYLITVFIYYFDKNKKLKEPSVVVRVKGDSEQMEDLSSRFEDEITEEDTHNSVPLFIHVEEKHEFSRGDIFNFVMYLIWPHILITFAILIGLFLMLFFVVLPLNSILFYIAAGFIGFVALVAIYIYFFFIPSKIYKRIVNNKLPTSFRVFNDRLEEVSLLVDGSEFSYVFKYDQTRFKEVKKYIYIKGVMGNKDRTTIGAIISKERVKPEIIDFIREKYKNK